MLIDNNTSSIYQFVSRWFFSTNHKCEVKASFVIGVEVPYRNAVTVKPFKAHLKYSKKVKQLIKVIFIESLGKQISIMVSPICGAGIFEIPDK